MIDNGHPLQIMFVYFRLNQKQLSKFVLIGIITFFINFLSFHYFYGIFQLNYKISASFSYAITVIAHFILHRTFTFKAEGNNKLGSNMAKYSLMLILNYITTISVMWLTVDVIHDSAYIGVVASTAATAALSFLIMKYFVFS